MKKSIFITVIIIMICMTGITVFSEEEEGKKDNDYLETGIETLDKINRESSYSIKDPADEKALDKATSYITRKQGEAIWALQVLAQPICIIVFLINAYITLIGGIGSHKMKWSGFTGMILSIVVYTIILYVQTIFQISVNFIGS
ncbi:hypothetical protein [Dethiothermospora halolimnae]|uniref:hypothetical protein n=1 Tax=Dethiothermospora halolimnae TaxID=3114390 RepID=UPI003CCBB2B5